MSEITVMDPVVLQGVQTMAPVVVSAASPGDGNNWQALQEHINSPTPHPAYDDDMPSLKLLFENGLI